MSPPFITFEGGEGVGKSTQQKMLVRRIKAMGLTVLATREPGGTPLGANLRAILCNGHAAPKAELLMYLADRAQHVAEVILPALKRGEVVICDRFADSSEVYQGRVRGLGLEQVRWANHWLCDGAWPDLTIYLDLDPAEGLKRVGARQAELGLPLDAMERENREFHHQLRQGFLDQAAAEPQRLKVVSAAQPPDEVADTVWEFAKPLLKAFKEQGGR